MLSLTKITQSKFVLEFILWSSSVSLLTSWWVVQGLLSACHPTITFTRWVFSKNSFNFIVLFGLIPQFVLLPWLFLSPLPFYYTLLASCGDSPSSRSTKSSKLEAAPLHIAYSHSIVFRVGCGWSAFPHHVHMHFQFIFLKIKSLIEFLISFQGVESW